MDDKLFDFDTPNFSQQFGNGTLSEQRGDQNNNQQKADAAGIINASANGLDSVGNFISMFTGKNINQQNYTPPPPPPKKKISPLVVGGIMGVLVLIILLIAFNNGKSKPKT